MMTESQAVQAGPSRRWAQPRSSIEPKRSTARPPGRFRLKFKPRLWATAYAFVLPAFGLTALFSIFPLFMVIRRSLYSGNIFDTDLTFAGLTNYRALFESGGGHSLVVTAIYTVGFVLVSMVAGIGIALLLDLPLPGLKPLRALFIIPLVVPAVGTAFIWFILFQPQTGLFNRILNGIGLPQVTLDNPTVAMVAIIAFGAWQFFGEVVILFLAALKTLPTDVIEASVVDGATGWQRLKYIRLPLLRPQTALVTVISTLTGLQAFTQIFVLTNGGPGGATQTALYYVYNQAFGLGAAGSIGIANAMAVLLFVISIAITIAQVVIVGRAARAVS